MPLPNRKMSIMAEEVWKTVPGVPHLIASSHGRVASIKGHASKVGYQVIGLGTKLPDGWPSSSSGRGGKKGYRTYAHTIIARTFLGDPPFSGAQVNHKDFDRLNNRVENLEWCSVGENIKHGYTRPGRNRQKPWKLRPEMREQVRTDYASGMFNTQDLADAFRVSRSTISKALKETA